MYQKELTERQKKIYLLRSKAQVDNVALQLFLEIENECRMILQTPNSVPETMVRAYDRLVWNSKLPLQEKKQLLFLEEKGE